MKLGYIYKITSPSSKVYIGQTINISNRKCHYKKLHCHKQKSIYNSINKYGWENHLFEIIEEVSNEQLNDREKHWIFITFFTF